MLITPILAEDIPPTVLLVFLLPLFLVILVIFGLRRMIVAAGGGSEEIRSGIAKRLIPVLGGGLLLFSLLTIRVGAPFSIYVVSVLLLIVGLWSLYLFGRKTPEAVRPVSITLRVLLCGFLALALIILCTKLLAK